MARQVITNLIDDLDGSPADETVAVGLDGALVTVDLSAVNAKLLREAVQPFRAVARRAGRVAVPPAARRAPLSRTLPRPPAPKPALKPRRVEVPLDMNTREGRDAVRDWARRTGRQVPQRARPPQSLFDEYTKARSHL